MNREHIEIAADSIVTRYALRKDTGELGSLENSIRKIGLIHPILIDRDNVLVSGSRRLEACRLAGIDPVPAIRLDIAYDEMAALDIQCDENLCREPLSADELEQHIARKEAVLKGKKPEGRKGIAGFFKRLFGVT